ncbi:MAG: hypothetical protein H6573_20585 [Lewinellaceae bacterium]|nr:hypothetical protein [Lewinellaceae bacterium]
MDKLNFKLAKWVLGIIGLFCVGILIYLYVSGNATSIEVTKLRFEIIKVVLASVVIGLLGILVPQQLAERKYKSELEMQDFELKKEGRRLYSVVETGLKYLPQRMAAMEYEEAMQHLQNIHQAYHLVVLYPDSDDPDIGNYRSFFNRRKIHKLREVFSELMCQEDYKKNDDVLKRIQLINEEWNKVSQKE